MKSDKKAFNVETPEDSPGFLLWQVTTLWQRGIKKALRSIDITHPQFVLLASLLWLLTKKGYVTQIDLSQHSKIDPMTTSAIIRILQRKDFIERQEHHSDTRAKTVILTGSGIKITKQAIKIIEKFDTEFFLSLENKTQEFNAALLNLLNSKRALK